MANVMLTDACNLKCPYCFANEFVNIDKNEISEQNFKEAVDFILRDGSCDTIGLIGGEPTLHSRFSEFVRMLILDERVKRIVVYTNGIYLDKYWDIICNPKVHFLINCNSCDNMGKSMYQKMLSNIDYLVGTRMFKNNVTLGINLYEANMETKYIVDLLIKYDYHRVRLSITVPNLDDNRNCNAHTYFISMKNLIFQFFKTLLENRIVPNFDCNKIPYCLITEEELHPFQKYLSSPELKPYFESSNIVNNIVTCSPVIDIRQDLTAVRCFGLSQYTKQSIADFKGLNDLQNFYMETVDALAYNLVYTEKCNNCYQRKILRCSGGCIAYKMNKVLEIQKYAEKLNGLI